MKIIDDYTVEIDDADAEPDFAAAARNLLHHGQAVGREAQGDVAATNVKGGDEGNYANLNANGTGPFIAEVASIWRQNRLVTRNPNYWGKTQPT